MVPALIFIPLAVAAVVALRRYYTRERVKLDLQSRRWWWERRKQDRDDLLETARGVVRIGKFRYQRPHESSWSYAKAFDRWSSRQLKMKPTAQWSKPYTQTTQPLQLPKLPRLPRVPRSFTACAHDETWPTWASVQFYWWAVERDGLVHRAVVLKHDHGESFVLRCDHDVLLEPTRVEQYPYGAGPILTCIRCFGMART